MTKCLLLEYHTMSESLAAMIRECDLGRQEVGSGAHAVPLTNPEVRTGEAWRHKVRQYGDSAFYKYELLRVKITKSLTVSY